MIQNFAKIDSAKEKNSGKTISFVSATIYRAKKLSLPYFFFAKFFSFCFPINFRICYFAKFSHFLFGGNFPHSLETLLSKLVRGVVVNRSHLINHSQHAGMINMKKIRTYIFMIY